MARGPGVSNAMLMLCLDWTSYVIAAVATDTVCFFCSGVRLVIEESHGKTSVWQVGRERWDNTTKNMWYRYSGPLPLCTTLRTIEFASYLWGFILGKHRGSAQEITSCRMYVGTLVGAGEHVDPFSFVSHGRTTDIRPGYWYLYFRK